MNLPLSELQAQQREYERLKRVHEKSSSSSTLGPSAPDQHSPSPRAANAANIASQRQHRSLRQLSLSLSELGNAPLPSVASIAAHGPLYDHITPTNEQLWISLCERVLSLYQEASKNQETSIKANIIAYLLQLPALTLTKMRGGKRAVKNRLHDKTVQRRLSTAIQLLPHVQRSSSSQQNSAYLPTPERNNFSPPGGAELPEIDNQDVSPLQHGRRLVFDAESEVKEEKEEKRSQADLDEKHNDPRLHSSFSSSTASMRSGVPSSLTELDQHMIKRVKRLIRTGHLRRATQTLNTTTTMADCTQPEVLAQLEQLHPDLPADAVIPGLPATSAPIQLSNDSHLRRILLHTNSGASGGPSGWAGNMLSTLVNSTTCMDGLACLFQDILNNDLPASIRPHILACRLVASNKPNGGKGIRPIAIGEMFYRVAATIAVRRVSDKAVKLLQPHQFGVGLPSGCERVIHILQHQLTDTTCKRAALQIDISNAFNTCNRALLLDKLYHTPELQPIWRISHFAYSTPSDLFFPQASTPPLQSRNGVRQGDPLSSLLFCLYIRDTLLDPTLKTEGVQPLAFIDDGYLVGPPAAVMHCFTHLQTTLPDLNLHINSDKSKFIYFHQHTNPVSQTVKDALDQHHISMEAESAEVLGAVIGRTTADIRDRMALLFPANHFQNSAFIRRLTSGELAVQIAMNLLRQSGIPRLGYLLRCMAPDCIDEVTDDFDRTVSQAAQRLLDIAGEQCTRYATHLLSAPLKLGGFGLTKASYMSPLAYLSSLATMAADGTLTARDMTDNDHELSTSSLAHTWLADCINRIHRLVTSPSQPLSLSSAQPDPTHLSSKTTHLPSSASSFVSFYRERPSRATGLHRHLSKLATHTLSTSAATEAIAQATSAQDKALIKAHLQCIQAPFASTWKTTLPSSAQTTLTDTEYRTAARLNLLLPPHSNTLPSKCLSCGNDEANARDPWHYLSCNHYKRRQATQRHDSIVRILHHYVHQAGGASTMEITGLDRDKDSHLRPDLEIVFPGQHLISDVVITHPLCPSHFPVSSRTPLAAANKAADGKDTKYKRLAKFQDARLLPFGIDTMGGYSDSATLLLDQITLACQDFATVLTPLQIARGLRAAIAIAVQKGNTAIILAAYARATLSSPAA
jgi:hypothetical protein